MKRIKIAFLWLAKSGSVGSGNTKHMRYWLQGIQEVTENSFDLLLITPFEEIPRLQRYFGEIQNFTIIQEKALSSRNFLKSSRLLADCLERNAVDLLHTLGIRADIIGGIAKKNGLAMPVVSSVEGYLPGFNPSLWKYYFYKTIYSYSSKHIDIITAISNKTKRELVSEFGVPVEKVAVINSGVEVQEYKLKTGWPFGQKKEIFPVIGYIGRLSPEKQVHLFLQACSIICKNFPKSRILIAGDGKEKISLERSLLALQLEKNVEFLGWLQDSKTFFDKIDILAMTSAAKSEGLPWTILEAAGSGVPIVTTNSGGIEDIIVQQETGLIAYNDSPEEIAKKISILIKDEFLAVTLAINARRKIEAHFNHKREIRDLMAIYNRLVGER
jgi:glycosyltransferase involved in cell wall biosynthesis